MNSPRKQPLARLAGALMLAAAQPMLEEVVVTAQKREESLQDTHPKGPRHS